MSLAAVLRLLALGLAATTVALAPAAPCAAATPPPPAVPGQDVVLLVVASSHSFDPSLPPLQFAQRDGARFAGIMESVGRVATTHVVKLDDPSVDAFPKAVDAVNKLVDDCHGCAAKFVFYYSGHADEEGLHLSDGLLTKERLHDALSAVHVPTKIVLLDSCFSGAIAKKGVQPAPTFELPRAEFDEPSGSIFISASSSREFSYESRDLGGSIFTYHVVAGLSGEADASGDGVVTVDELYQYVYRETKLASLFLPSTAVQTPEFVSRLEGRGAVAMSFPAQTNAQLVLESDVGGQVTLAARDGIQLFKIDKTLGTRRSLQLPPGRYQVTVSEGHRFGQSQVALEPRKLASLAGSEMAWTDRTLNVTSKGPGGAQPASFGVIAGGHSGYTSSESAGPFAAFALRKPLGGVALRETYLEALAGGEALVDHEGDDWARTGIYRVMAGGGIDLLPSPSQRLVASSKLGVALHDQQWHYAERDARRFRTVMPALTLGLGWDYLLSDRGWRVGLALQRDFLAANDADAGRRIIAGNAVGLTVGF